jgi:hypothetical protein
MSSTTLSPTQGNKNKGGNYKQTQRFFLIIRMFILSLGVLFVPVQLAKWWSYLSRKGNMSSTKILLR